MPLSSLTCPICLAVLKPKTPVMEGTRVRCPKCKGAFVAEGAPAAEPREPEPTQQAMPDAAPAEEEILEAVEAEDDEPAAPRRRPRDRDDDEEDRPRRKIKKGGIPVWVWLAGGGVGLMLLCGCCGIGGWVAWSAMAGNGPVTAAKYNELKRGMTPAEVHNILGPPTNSSSLLGVQAETWQNNTDYITVTYQNNKAVSRSCNVQHNGAIQLQDSGLLPW